MRLDEPIINKLTIGTYFESREKKRWKNKVAGSKNTCLCKLLSSTTSLSTMPKQPVTKMPKIKIEALNTGLIE